MAYGTVNTPGVSKAGVEDVKALVQSTLEEAQAISGKVGETGDTGGSATAGTIFGKLNKLISDLTTHMGRWTAARAGYIDTINTNVASVKTSTDKVGATGDTGGSASAGTLMGKLNKLISDITTHAASWTSTRAGYIDTIKTDAAAAKSNTAANNTASPTGTLSQKLSHVIDLLTSGGVNEKLETIVTQTQSVGIVKSIQRGVAALSADSPGNVSSYSTDITINSVNPDKCMVITQVTGRMNSGFGGAMTTSLSSTQLHIEGESATMFGWQVIEFY